jgi:hypothetical protein
MSSVGQKFAVWVVASSHVELSIWKDTGPKFFAQYLHTQGNLIKLLVLLEAKI